jgi:hypothetical protein
MALWDGESGFGGRTKAKDVKIVKIVKAWKHTKSGDLGGLGERLRTSRSPAFCISRNSAILADLADKTALNRRKSDNRDRQAR